MITLKEWMEIVEYKITEGYPYCWSCFGNNAYGLDNWNGDNTDGFSIGIIFDTKTQEVYQVEAHDYKRQCSYQYTNPLFKAAFDNETRARGASLTDEYPHHALDSEDDWIEKATAIFNGIDYDTRIVVPLNFDKEELHMLIYI